MHKKTTTDANELFNAGKLLLGDSFIGVFPMDKIPPLRKNTGVIVNLDTSKQKGSHWIAIFKFLNGKTLVYDSFGRDLTKYIKVKGKAVDTSDREQRDPSIGDKNRETNCGQRSLSFLTL